MTTEVKVMKPEITKQLFFSTTCSLETYTHGRFVPSSAKKTDARLVAKFHRRDSIANTYKGLEESASFKFTNSYNEVNIYSCHIYWELMTLERWLRLKHKLDVFHEEVEDLCS
jgi:hypothetical protein